MAGPSRTLRLGDAAPDFALTDAVSGDRVRLGGLLRERAGLLLVFHRGFW
jgi:peroxiredoxin